MRFLSWLTVSPVAASPLRLLYLHLSKITNPSASVSALEKASSGPKNTNLPFSISPHLLQTTRPVRLVNPPTQAARTRRNLAANLALTSSDETRGRRRLSRRKNMPRSLDNSHRRNGLSGMRMT